MIIAGGTVRIASGGELRGGARCRTLVVDPGALIRGGPFEAPSDALGTIDIDTAARSVPGKGPAAKVEALAANSAMEIEGKPLVITAPQTPAGPPPRLRVVR